MHLLLFCLLCCAHILHRGHCLSEVSGYLEVQHEVDLRDILTHLQLWSRDLNSTAYNKVSRSLASSKTQRLNLLIANLLRECNSSLTTSTLLPTPPPASNDARRFKRNILGDLLHTLTGVATDEQLQEQLRMDKEIRAKVTSLMTHQVTYEESMTSSLSQLQKGETEIAGHVDELSSTFQREMNRLYRVLAYSSFLDDDIALLSDSLESISTGIAPATLSAYLSSKCGLTTVLHLSYKSARTWERGVVISYISYLYSKAEVVFPPTTSRDTQTLVTHRSTYLLHPAHLHLPSISELEVYKLFYY